MQNSTAIIGSNPLPLQNISEVPALSDDDADCMNELYEVLKKHDCVNRFGITLLHKHFDVAGDEVLLETNDPRERTLLMRVVKKSELQDTDYKETSWHLGTGEPLMACVCVQDSNGHGHYSRG